MTDDKLAVSQEAREAAAPFAWADGDVGTMQLRYDIRHGKRDDHPVVQAFARFEAQARRAGMDRAASLATKFLVGDPANGVPLRSPSPHEIASAILKEAASITPEAEVYLIRKHGLFYRPNAQGYTNSLAEAGRYTLEDAIRHSHPNGPYGPRDGITYVSESEWRASITRAASTGEIG